MRKLLSVLGLLAMLCGVPTAMAADVEGRGGLVFSEDWTDPAAKVDILVRGKRQMFTFAVSAPWENSDGTYLRSCRWTSGVNLCTLNPYKHETPVTARVAYRYWIGKRLGAWGEAETDDLRGETVALGVAWKIR